jgi:hypothetical protein
VGFRTKCDLRNHQAIIQPRLYDCLMVTQITLILRILPGLLTRILEVPDDGTAGSLLAFFGHWLMSFHSPCDARY